MAKLILLRHAKAVSNWQEAADNHRPLTENGVNAAIKLAGFMRRHDYFPTMVMVSPAQRTIATFSHLLINMAATLPENRVWCPHIEVKSDLYSSDEIALLQMIRAQSTEFLMVVGHNPTMHGMAIQLCANPNEPPARAMSQHFPPGSMAVFDLDGPLSRLQLYGARLEQFITPAMLDEQI
ncbi:MAG: SixA phosphatase family protein [Alphaproteobacteria bacterium]